MQSRKLLDPINRLYRYRIANLLAPFFQSISVTPNMITLAHTGVGLFAAYLVYKENYIYAALFFELRTILDCVDGALARLQNCKTAWGRTLDTLGDGIAFNALMIAGAFRMIRDFQTYNPYLITLGVFGFAWVTAHNGTVYHLMRRKLGSIISKDVDTVEMEWKEQYESLRIGTAGRSFFPIRSLLKIGFWIDSITIRFVSVEWYRKLVARRDSPDWKNKALAEANLLNELARMTRKYEFKMAVRSTAYVSDDNVFAVISFCFLIQGIFPQQIFPHVHPVLVAFGAGLAYALVSLSLGLHYLHDFLHGIYRD